MNRRLAGVLNRAKRMRKKLFCAYVTLGFPNLNTTREVLRALEQSGADIIELGFPFSDPLADGPTIQMASERALKKGVNVRDACRLVSQLRRKGFKTPVIFFSYLNPMIQFGAGKIAARLRQAGFDGVIIPDLTFDEGKTWELLLKRNGLALIYLVAPTTTKERMRKIANRSQGFVYYVSLRGVTGARTSLSADLKENLKKLKRSTSKPILVGFGVSRPAQARTISRLADGVIVGSAFVKLLQTRRKVAPRVQGLVSRLAGAMR